MKNRVMAAIVVSALAVGMLTAVASWAAVEAPQGAIVERNIDLAAQKAFNAWVTQLLSAPNTENVQNIGIVPLAGDNADFTTLLAERLTAEKKLHVVVLSGAGWDAIEEEMARQDPDSGLGDIMDKATIKWQESRGSYVIPETTKGTDALLIGNVRSIDGDWLRARTRFTLHLVKVDTREQIGGSVAEGESMMTFRDLLIYYKVQVMIAILLLIGLIIVWRIWRSFLKAATRPR